VTEATQILTPRIDAWIGGTLAAIEQGLWQRGDLVYFNRDDLLHRCGERFAYDRTRPLPDDVTQGQLGECFMNAGREVGGAYRYVEGLAITSDSIMPVHHAWLIDDDDNVIDNTWAPDLEAVRGDEDGAREYLGIIIPDERVFEVITRRKVWGCLDDPSFYTKEWQG
jgi:hypothetical protein